MGKGYWRSRGGFLPILGIFRDPLGGRNPWIKGWFP